MEQRAWFIGSLTQKLVLINGLIFGLAATLVIVFVMFVSDRFMRSHLQESVQSELQAVLADYEIDGPDGVRNFVTIRSHMRSNDHERTYRMEDAQGRLIAGTWPAWPAELSTDGRLVKIPNHNNHPPTDWWMAAARLPNGSRVLTGFDSIEHRTVMAGLWRGALGGIATAFVLALLVGLITNRAALAQVGTIRRSAEQIINGDLHHRIPHRNTDDEFDALSKTLNAMLDRISELMLGLRNATDAIAHDLRSPLARHRARLEAALRSPPAPAEMEVWLQHNLADVDRLLGTFNALLQLATVESGVLRRGFKSVRLAPLLEDVSALYEAAASERGIVLHTDLPPSDPPICVQGDINLLFQSLANLLDNALKFSPDGGEIRLNLQSTATEVWIDVIDQGRGIPATDTEWIFKRLTRGDTARHTDGHGLGLTLVRAVARLHGGDATVIPSARGAHLRLRLPR